MNKIAYNIGFSVLVIIAGAILETLNIGSSEFLGFTSVGNWLVYVGLVGLAIVAIRGIAKKDRKVDERMYFIANKANRVTFLVVIIGSFVIMVWDGIQRITMPYSLFMSYFVCGVIMAYVIAYKVLVRMY